MALPNDFPYQGTITQKIEFYGKKSGFSSMCIIIISVIFLRLNCIESAQKMHENDA